MASADEWGFYGRQKELNNLNRWMSNERFLVIAVIGRRGVGKIELIRQAANSLDVGKPFIFLEIPDVPESPSDTQYNRAMSELCNELVNKSGSFGLADAVPTYNASEDYTGKKLFLYCALESLVKRGAVVVLDEFQHAKSLMLASGVKRVIDDIKFERDPHAKGKIVFAGSHQQKILEMLHHPQAPLFQRVNHLQCLYPLSAPALLEMAADQ